MSVCGGVAEDELWGEDAGRKWVWGRGKGGYGSGRAVQIPEHCAYLPYPA